MLTAVIAWVVFRENVDSQVFLGMVAIVAGGTLLSWTPGAGVPVGALLIVGACLCWAVDNNPDPQGGRKRCDGHRVREGLIAGPVNIGIALATGATLPAVPVTAAAMLTARRLRDQPRCSSSHCVISAARTGAYFSIAPLFGVVLSLLIWPRCRPRRSGSRPC